MALFNFGKKKDENMKVCTCERTVGEVEKTANNLRGEVKDGSCHIKVLGAGCKSCREQYENTKEAGKAMGLSADIEYITDMKKVMEYGVMSMPAVVVNEKVVSMGKVLKAADVENLLHKSGF